MIKAWFGSAGRPGIDALPRPERLTPHRYLPVDGIEFGVVVAIADLVDAHDAESGCCSSPWAEEAYVDADGRLRTQVVHLVLASRFALEVPVPVPHGGRLGIWRPEPDLAEELSEALVAVR